MTRLPFDPARAGSPPPAAPGDVPRGDDAGEPNAMTVSEAAALIRTAVAAAAPGKIRIVGEVSNLSRRSHWFFSLKDDGATLRCVCFASQARRVNFPVEDGMEVVAVGRLDYYDAQGAVQLYVDRLEPVGVGALELKLRALCEELRAAGYFDPQRKRPMPLLPRRVAVVTSRSGAALQDVCDTAWRRWPGVELLLCDVRVQGAAAAPEIAATLDALSACGEAIGVEAIILTRGGGSIEDLWAFNERQVAEAVHECRIPVISAVGHEVDFTICDFVADLRAETPSAGADAVLHCSLPIAAAIGHETDTTIAELVADLRCATPTQAAMHVVPDVAAFTHQLDQSARRLTLSLERLAMQARHRLDAAARFALFRNPRELLDRVSERLDAAAARLERATPRRLDAARDRLDALAGRLRAVGPRSVLARGYSYTLGPAGAVLRDPTDAAPGDVIRTVLERGELRSIVSKGANESSETVRRPDAKPETSSPAGRRRRRRRPSDQPGLFASPGEIPTADDEQTGASADQP